MREIPNNILKPTDIPGPDVDWGDIGEFVLTFDGYEAWGSFEKCAEIANAQQHDSLTALRTCLFFEQRRWRHFGYKPDEEVMEYIQDVVENIHIQVTIAE